MESLTRDEFVTVITNIQRSIGYQDDLNKLMKKNDVYGVIYQPNCVDDTLRLLNKHLGKENYKYVHYFINEADFGKKTDRYPMNDNGVERTFHDADELWKFIIS